MKITSLPAVFTLFCIASAIGLYLPWYHDTRPSVVASPSAISVLFLYLPWVFSEQLSTPTTFGVAWVLSVVTTMVSMLLVIPAAFSAPAGKFSMVSLLLALFVILCIVSTSITYFGRPVYYHMGSGQMVCVAACILAAILSLMAVARTPPQNQPPKLAETL